MTKFTPFGLTVPIAFFMTAVLGGCATFEKCDATSCRDDANITAKVQTHLDRMAGLGPPGSITVQTTSHVVYLSGTVDGGLEKRTAASEADKVPGVTQVINDIAVSHD